MSLADRTGYRSRIRRGRDTFQIMITASRIDFGMMQGGRGRHWTHSGSVPISSPQAAQNHQALASSLQSLPEAPPGAKLLRVLVSDYWLAVTLLPWHAALARLDTAVPHAWKQLRSAGFDLQPADRVCIDDTPYGSARLALAWPERLQSALQQWASRSDLTLVSLLPLSIFLCRQTQLAKVASQSCFAWVDDASISIASLRHAGRFSRPQLTGLSLRAVPSGQSLSRCLRDTWSRLVLREGARFAMHQDVPLFDLSAQVGQAHTDWPAPFMQIGSGVAQVNNPTHRLGNLLMSPTPGRLSGSALDAGSAHPPWAGRHWLALAACISVALFFAVQAVQHTISVQVLQGQLARHSVVEVLPERSWSREERLRIQSVNAAVRELNTPIAALLRALDPPQNIQVALLSVKTISTHAQAMPAQALRITALAQGSADMVRYVALVARQRPFYRAYLTRHEIRELEGKPRWQFTFEAQWSE